MSIVLDGRPPGIVVPFRPGTTMTLTLRSSVAGALAGRTFTSTLDGAALTCTVNGDVLTVEATAAQTTTAGLGLNAWVLNETTSGTPEPIVTGYWEGSNDPALTPGETSATIVEGDLVADLTINVGGVSAAVLAAHAALTAAHGWVAAPGGATKWNGPVLTNHDRYWFEPKDFVGNAQLIENNATNEGVAFWSFDSAVSERIKIQWTPGDGWQAYTMRVAWLNPGGDAVGNVRWRYRELQLPFGSNPTATPPLINTTPALAAPTILGQAWAYHDVATNVPITPGGLGETPRILSVIDRDPTVTDNLGNDAGIWGVSVTRA